MTAPWGEGPWTRPARLAWLLAGFAVLLAAIQLGVGLLNDAQYADQLLSVLPFAGLVVVGALIAAHRPRNPIGWLFCAAGLAIVVNATAMLYARHTLVDQPGSLPAGPLLAWLGMSWSADIGWGLMALVLPLLFPTGRLLSRRWRVILWLGLVTIVTRTVFHMIVPGPIDSEVLPGVQNPVGVAMFREIAGVIELGLSLLSIAVVVASVISLILRFRRASGEERAQLKWFAFSVLFLGLLIVLGITNDSAVHNTVFDRISTPLFAIGVLALPTSAAIAILRYRLYDIDLIINRALVYSALTLTLGVFYVGAVIGLQSLFQAVTGQHSDLAIAIATLGVAALFNPWRHRVQGFIDRQFYRRRYDAAQTLAALQSHLRDEVDLDQLTADVLAVVQETIEPARVSLWLR